MRWMIDKEIVAFSFFEEYGRLQVVALSNRKDEKINVHIISELHHKGDQNAHIVEMDEVPSHMQLELFAIQWMLWNKYHKDFDITFEEID